VGGQPPVANFGQAFPAIQFWTVPQVRDALQHVFGAGATTMTDWQVLLYTSGRAMLWVVVLSACLSMYEYFHAFFVSMSDRAAARRAKPTVPAAARPTVR